jgi:hypothetical protein
MINWNCTHADLQVIARIAKRAAIASTVYTQGAAFMGIQACHCNGTPLQLEALSNAKHGDFAHDVFGIMCHINLETGKLENCFLPRYSMKPATVEENAS